MTCRHRYTLKKHGAAIALEFNFSSKFSRTVEKADCARKKKAPRAAGSHFPSQLNDQRKLGLFGDRFPALLLRCMKGFADCAAHPGASVHSEFRINE